MPCLFIPFLVCEFCIRRCVVAGLEIPVAVQGGEDEGVRLGGDRKDQTSKKIRTRNIVIVATFWFVSDSFSINLSRLERPELTLCSV
jgi:hypothetical protein